MNLYEKAVKNLEELKKAAHEISAPEEIYKAIEQTDLPKELKAHLVATLINAGIILKGSPSWATLPVPVAIAWTIAKIQKCENEQGAT